MFYSSNSTVAKQLLCKGTVCHFVIFGPLLYIQLYDMIIEVHVVWLN